MGLTLGVLLNLAWLVFELRAWVPAGLIVDALKAVQLAVMLVMLCRVRRVHWVHGLALVAGSAVIVLAGVVALTVLALGANLVSSVRAFPQLVTSWSAEPDAVSVASWVLAGTCALGWLLYGFLIDVPLAGAFGVVLGPSSLVLAARVAWRRHHLETPAAAPGP